MQAYLRKTGFRIQDKSSAHSFVSNEYRAYFFTLNTHTHTHTLQILLARTTVSHLDRSLPHAQHRAESNICSGGVLCLTLVFQLLGMRLAGCIVLQV